MHDRFAIMYKSRDLITMSRMSNEWHWLLFTIECSCCQVIDKRDEFCVHAYLAQRTMVPASFECGSGAGAV